MPCPPFVGVGSETARSGTSCVPAKPPVWSKATRPSFVMRRSGHAVESYATAVSIESVPRFIAHGQRAAAVARTGMTNARRARRRPATATPCGRFPTVELLGDLVRARVDPGEGSAELVRHPHAPGAPQRPRWDRPQSRRDSPDGVRLRVDSRHGPVEAVRDPDAPVSRRDSRRARCRPEIATVWSPVSGSMRTTRFAPRWLAQRVPSRKARLVAGIGKRLQRLALIGVDPCDGPVAGVRDPDRAVREGDADRTVAHVDRLDDACSSRDRSARRCHRGC